MLRGAGIDSLNTRLLLVGVLGIASLVATLAGGILTDHVGRRPQLITGSVMNAVFLLLTVVLNAANIVKTADGYVAKSGPTARAQIAMMYLFFFFSSVGWSSLSILYPVECLRFETRAKGMSMYMVCPLSPLL